MQCLNIAIIISFFIYVFYKCGGNLNRKLENLIELDSI